MDIPDTERLILPVLQLLSQHPLTSAQLQDGIAEQFGLTDEQRRQQFPDSKLHQTIFENRIAFALKDLNEAALISPEEYPKAPREITPRGREVVSNPPETKIREFLKNERDNNGKRANANKNTPPISPQHDFVKTPTEPKKLVATPTVTSHPEPTVSVPTNLILYGPPGTGKTFTTAVEAVRLCGKPVSNIRVELKRSYDALVEAGQIAFVTFHQNYSYEDFVEGLRPTTGTEEGEERPGFHLTPRRGIFREVSALAEQARKAAGRTGGFDVGNRQVFKLSLGRAGVEDHIFEAAIEDNYIVLGLGGAIDWSDPRYDGNPGYDAIRDTWQEIEPGQSGNSDDVSQLWRFRSSMREGDLVVISWGNSHFRAIGEIAGPYQYDPTETREYKHRRTVQWLLVPDEPLPVDTLYDKPFSMRSCYLLDDNHLKREALVRLLPSKAVAANAMADQFVLIIDEINRANISKVFGELITLLEPDKRIGAENELKVKLPYSGETFGVPPNLHIIGTMNTADRSIALLDTALRRRFEFRELMPDPTCLREELDGVPLQAMLRRINERIEYLFDREHQIGHAYFLDCENKVAIESVIRRKVIPLLAEYFYEDWGKVALVLGDADGRGGFLERQVLKVPDGFGFDNETRERYRWTVRDRFADDAYEQFR